MMRIFHSFDEFISTKPSVVAVGTFDGMHLGHTRVIDEVTQIAEYNNYVSVAVTFNGHPMRKLHPKRVPCSLTTTDEKIGIIKTKHIDAVVVVDFDSSISNLSPDRFIDLLNDKLGCKWIVMGYDNAFGKGREGTPDYVRELAHRRRFGFTLVNPLKIGNITVSSSEIRRQLGFGDVKTAAALLGRHYYLTGSVVHGDRRGRTLGFPTANVTVVKCKCLPLNGVYATKASINGRSLPSITNVGVRPTFYSTENAEIGIEVHLFEEHASIYGQEIRLEFIDFIRPEQRFAEAQSLISQINMDVSRAKDILSSVCF